MEQIVQSHVSTMANKNRKKKNWMRVVKSKLKSIAYKPEVQKTDLTYVYETHKNSHAKHVLICHILRMHWSSYPLLFKDHFQNHWLIQVPKMPILKIL